TIQKEQNKIIRNVGSPRLIVQGVAGSGKTSAVMQRIAYLMYRYRGDVHPNQMMMFSPNPLFSSYIANVLPELGETNIRQSTFLNFLKDRIGCGLRIESPFRQMEYVLTREEEDEYDVRLKNIHFKSSLDYKDTLDGFVNKLKQEGIQFRNITLRKRVLMSKEEIASYFYNLGEEMSIPNRMERVLNWLLKKIEKHQDIEKNKDWVMAQVELMDKEDYAEAYYKSQEGDEVDSSVEEEFLREEVARRVFSSIKNRLKQYAFVNVLATYKKLFHDFKPVNEPSDWEEIRMFTEKILRKKQLTWEDAAPYAYFQDQLLGATKNRSVRYLFIDEAQDYSMFQYAYIEFLFPYTRMTLLGDINQAIYSYASEENPLLAEYAQEKITLTKSYRSTKQIVEFTSCFAPGNERIEPFHMYSDKPQLVKINNSQNIKEIIHYVKESRDKGYESIAIIGKTMQETKRLYNELKDELNTRLIHEETYSFQKGVLLLPTSLAKGIEFDVVIIPDASNEAYGKDRDQTIFYTACTRAMHQLII